MISVILLFTDSIYRSLQNSTVVYGLSTQIEPAMFVRTLLLGAYLGVNIPHPVHCNKKNQEPKILEENMSTEPGGVLNRETAVLVPNRN